MSIYYNFITEAKFDGQWICIGWKMMDHLGRVRPCYNCSINAHDLYDEVESLISNNHLRFDELAVGSQEAVLDGYLNVRDSTDLEGNIIKVNEEDVRKYVAGRKYYQIDPRGVESLYRMIRTPRTKQTGFVNIIDAIKLASGETDDIEEYLNIEEFNKLPDSMKNCYVMLMWISKDDKEALEQLKAIIFCLNTQKSNATQFFGKVPEELRLIIDIC